MGDPCGAMISGTKSIPRIYTSSDYYRKTMCHLVYIWLKQPRAPAQLKQRLVDGAGRRGQKWQAGGQHRAVVCMTRYLSFRVVVHIVLCHCIKFRARIQCH